MQTSSIFKGPRRRLIIAFDIGTTYSGVSYAFLDPGFVPKVMGVTRFPAQEQLGGDSKIPTTILYNRDGAVLAVGAEVEEYEGRIGGTFGEHGLSRASWFKLLMAPTAAKTLDTIRERSQLPKGKAFMDVFGDFLRYLYDCTRTYIQQSHLPNGLALWASVEQDIQYVISHPNGWGGAQQAQLRAAALIAGLIPDTNKGHSRVRFVTEGEASFHFCIANVRALSTEGIMEEGGKGVVIVDAAPYEEIAAAECHFHGSVFVTQHFRVYLETLLRNSQFSQDIEHIARSFDTKNGLRFKNNNDPQYISFGSHRDTDETCGVKERSLKVAGAIVAACFDPTIKCILAAILRQRDKASQPISSVFLVGGFAANAWLFKRLQYILDQINLKLYRPDRHMNKAVADGAVYFQIDRAVSSRVSKYVYGVVQQISYDRDDPEHVERLPLAFVDVTGQTVLPKSFSIILPKDIQVNETKTFSNTYHHDLKSIEAFKDQITSDLFCYQGPSENPRWMDEEHECYMSHGTIVIETEKIKHLIKRMEGAGGQVFYRMTYDILISFGSTEMSARFSWNDKGRRKSSSAKIIYD